MSIKHMSAVWESSRQSGSRLLLLLAIADNARNDDGVAWPGVPYLAQKVRMSERQVIRNIDALIESGELSRVSRGGKGAKDTAAYRINITANKGDILSDSPVNKGDILTIHKGDRLSSKGDILTNKGDIAMSPEPVNHQENHHNLNPHRARAKRGGGAAVDALKAEAESQYALVMEISGGRYTSESAQWDDFEAEGGTRSAATALLAIGGWDAIRKTDRPDRTARDFHFAYLRAAGAT